MAKKQSRELRSRIEFYRARGIVQVHMCGLLEGRNFGKGNSGSEGIDVCKDGMLL
jgi:hypothetical protein